MTQQAPDRLVVLQVLVPERAGDKPQLPSHASLKGTAKKYTLDACLDGTVSQVKPAKTTAPCADISFINCKSCLLIYHCMCRRMLRRSAMWMIWLMEHCKALLSRFLLLARQAR